MSSKSISPIPAQEPSGEKPAVSSGVGDGSVPDLSAIRKNWAKHVKNLPSLPREQTPGSPPDSAATEKGSMVTESSIPELPSMGAIASQAVLAMEDRAEFFGESPPQFSAPPTSVSPLPSFPNPSVSDSHTLSSEPSIFNLGTEQQPTFGLPRQPYPHQKTTPSFPQIPEMTLSSDTWEAKDKLSAKGPEDILSAMPTMAEPNVSLPLVRDQFLTPPAETPPHPVEPVDPPQKEEEITQEELPLPVEAAKPVDAISIEAPIETPIEPVEEEPIAAKEVPVAHSAPEKSQTSRVEKTEEDILPVSERSTSPASPPPPAESPKPEEPKAPEYTDRDLQEALHPFIAPTVDKFLYTPTHGIHTYLEPMLRSTVRRAIAEQMEDASPFLEVTGWDKFAWKMRALIGSRTYEDIVFDHTKRYHVEEVFLLRPKSRSLISYASSDPLRHAKPGKVQDTVKKIAAKTADKDQKTEGVMEWENSRNLMIRKGQHCLLAAIVHGPSNAILRADLDYALRQAEERFGKTLEEESDIHVQILQPLLEGCLLIQAPAIPN